MTPAYSLTAILALVATACSSTITGGGDGGGDATTGPGSPGSSPAAVALFAGELPSIPCEAGRCPSEDSLFLIANSWGATCVDPTASPRPAPPYWSLRIGVPPALQRVGTIDLFAGPDVFAGQEVASGPNDGGAVTATGGFGFSSGTLEILSIDDVAITFRVEGATIDVGIPSDGEYTAPRCGASSWPTEGSTSSGGG